MKIILVFLLTLGLSILIIYNGFLVGSFIDLIIEDASTDNIYNFITSLLLPVILANILVLILYSYISQMVSTQVMAFINHYILAHIQKIPLSYYKDKDTSYITQSINIDSHIISSFLVIKTTSFLKECITIIILLLAIYFISIEIFLILVIFIPFFVLIYFFLKRKLYKTQEEMKKSQSTYFSKMYQQIYNIKAVKTNVYFEELSKDIDNGFENLYMKFKNYMKVDIFFNNSCDIIIKIVMIVFLFFSGISISKNNMTIGEFIILQTYIVILLGSINSILDYFKNYQEMLVSYNRSEGFLSVNKESNGEKRINKIDSITIENLSFKYNEDNTILKDFSYSFSKGKTYCLCGKNGSGKSTLLNLVVGLYEDYEGKILFNSEPQNILDMYYLRKLNIAVLDQEPFMFGKTIYKNITYGLEKDIDIEYLDKIAKDIDIYDFINQLDEKYNTFVSQDTLSGGQKQKIMLMRCIAKETDVLILDEPTSALDVKSIKLFIDLINTLKKDKIVIIITHNDEILNIADGIIQMDSLHVGNN